MYITPGLNQKRDLEEYIKIEKVQKDIAVGSNPTPVNTVETKDNFTSSNNTVFSISSKPMSKLSKMPLNPLSPIQIRKSPPRLHKSTNFMPIRTMNKQVVLSYKAKRDINISTTSGEIPIKRLGKATIDCSKLFSNSRREKDERYEHLQEFAEMSKFTGNNYEQEFKTNYLIKFGQDADNYSKMLKNKDLISVDQQKNFTEMTNRINKLILIQTQCLFEDAKPKTTGTRVFSSITEETKEPALNRKLITSCHEFNAFIYKYVNMIFNELRVVKDNHLKLMKKSNDQEINLNAKIKELNELKNYLNRFDINTKIIQKQSKEISISKLKKEFNEKENSYLISIYKLEDEIKSLIKLLDRNKYYFNKYKESEKKIEEDKKIREEMKSVFNKELHEQTVQIAIKKDKEEELQKNIEDLEKLILNFKLEKEQKKREEIEMQPQIRKLQMNVMEKTENIVMLNEEMEYYLGQYNIMQKEINDYKIRIQILEQRLKEMREPVEMSSKDAISKNESKMGSGEGSMQKEY